MALTSTTLNGGITADDVYVQLTSATGARVNNLLRVDNETMTIQDVSNAPIVKVFRGQKGSAQVAHANLATAVFGPSSDFSRIPAPSVFHYSAAGAIDPKPGLHIIKAASGSAFTLRRPTADEQGVEIQIVAANAQTHTVTQTTPGFNSGSTATDVATFNAIGDSLTLKAVNTAWLVVGNEGVSLG